MGYGGILVKGGKLSLSISLLWWGMDLVFFFGMISGLGMSLLKVFILNYFCVQLIMRLVFLICLKSLYSQLFLCSANKEACIFDVLSPSVGDNNKVWSLRFQREFND